MLQPIDKRFKIPSFLVLYLISSVQIGVGVLGFQPFIFDAGNDGWIAVILAGLMVHMVIWVIYTLLNKGQRDLIDIHKYVFGKWLGHTMDVLTLFYFLFTSIVVLRSYIEIVQVWVFNDMETWSFALVFMLLTYYIVMGGFRTVTGICFFSLVLPSYLMFTFLYPIEFARWENLLPILETDIMPLFKASLNMTLSYLGFSTLLIFYPFIEEGQKSQKWAHLGTFITTTVYVFIEIISITYYSKLQLKEVNWPTLGLWKIVELPFVERFEYIGISSWLIVILPNIALMMWTASRIAKRVSGFKQKYLLVILLIFLFIGCNFFDTREQINQLSNAVANFGKYFVFGYIPLLLVLQTIIGKVRKGV
ncbi:GerAB/ArcD/ProY family transporter [Bacillus sp. Marseille-P3661]|uniref:GerAB/ArcD/ProY family transporter n=1 Tax=Bacillus sp. Marseille-P3661 TaxID=1936234 RepID=UPI000C8535E1|nr:GerAB/ArcD/ProY family transporter [Bacillus sp. Marseille-P3661]